MSTALSYAAIPDTSDAGYWKVKAAIPGERMTVFVPRNKPMHRALLILRRSQLQEQKQAEQQQNRGYNSTRTTNKATWGLDTKSPL